MSQELVRTQYVISLRNGMIAYIVADDLTSIAQALQTNKFFNTKESMLINTADIVAIMSPSEYEDQQKYVRGWYKSHRGTKWYNKKGEYEEETELGIKYYKAQQKMSEVQTKEEALAFIEKLSTSPVRGLIEERFESSFVKVLELAEVENYRPLSTPPHSINKHKV